MKKIITKALGYYLNTAAVVAPKIAARHSFNIWCYPFRTPLKPYHREFLDSAEKFSFYHNNTRVQGYRWGNGEKNVLFLHGWQSHSFRWRNFIQSLSPDDYTIYAIDAPGHGLSGGKMLNVPIYSNVIQQLIQDTGEFHAVVSHSIGSFSILHALHHTPSLPVRRLVLMAPPGNAHDFMIVLRDTLKLSEKAIRITLDYFESVFQKKPDYFSTAAFASTLTIPGLIIHDRDDEETPYKYAVQISEAWKNSQLISTSGLRHNLKSPEVTGMVNSFIASEEVTAHHSVSTR